MMLTQVLHFWVASAPCLWRKLDGSCHCVRKRFHQLAFFHPGVQVEGAMHASCSNAESFNSKISEHPIGVEFQHAVAKIAIGLADRNNQNNLVCVPQQKKYIVYAELPKVKDNDHRKSSCIVGSILRFHFLLRFPKQEGHVLRCLPVDVYHEPCVNFAVIHRPFITDKNAECPIPLVGQKHSESGSRGRVQNETGLDRWTHDDQSDTGGGRRTGGGEDSSLRKIKQEEDEGKFKTSDDRAEEGAGQELTSAIKKDRPLKSIQGYSDEYNEEDKGSEDKGGGGYRKDSNKPKDFEVGEGEYEGRKKNISGRQSLDNFPPSTNPESSKRIKVTIRCETDDSPPYCESSDLRQTSPRDTSSPKRKNLSLDSPSSSLSRIAQENEVNGEDDEDFGEGSGRQRQKSEKTNDDEYTFNEEFDKESQRYENSDDKEGSDDNKPTKHRPESENDEDEGQEVNSDSRSTLPQPHDHSSPKGLTEENKSIEDHRIGQLIRSKSQESLETHRTAGQEFDEDEPESNSDDERKRTKDKTDRESEDNNGELQGHEKDDRDRKDRHDSEGSQERSKEGKDYGEEESEEGGEDAHEKMNGREDQEHDRVVHEDERKNKFESGEESEESGEENDVRPSRDPTHGKRKDESSENTDKHLRQQMDRNISTEVHVKSYKGFGHLKTSPRDLDAKSKASDAATIGDKKEHVRKRGNYKQLELGPPKKPKKYFMYCEVPKVLKDDYRKCSVILGEVVHVHFLMKIAANEETDQLIMRKIKRFSRARVNFAVVHRMLLINPRTMDQQIRRLREMKRRPSLLMTNNAFDAQVSTNNSIMHATLGFILSKGRAKSQDSLVATNWRMSRCQDWKLRSELELSRTRRPKSSR